MLHWVKEEIRALVVCALLLLVGVVFVFVWNGRQHSAVSLEVTEEDRQVMDSLEKQIHSDSLSRSQTVSKQHRKLFPFDPNHTDSITFLDLGLQPWQIANLMKYRRKGGIWRTAEHFSKLYGLSAEEFVRLRPYIRISAKDKSRKTFYEERQRVYQQRAESLHYDVIQKLSEGTTLELSSADTSALKQIPGIGSYYAGKIVRYRDRLGGFVSVEQLNEIEGLPDRITRWFTLDQSSVVCQIKINHATFKQLVRHPYLSYEQTKVIVNHIRKYGPITGWKDLRLYKEFSESDFQRLAPYILFE